ncbi:MAG: ABC transporter permease [Anaerolineae bacterium]|nr:ABC transporter permease [Phycisphaerae bacterium]
MTTEARNIPDYRSAAPTASGLRGALIQTGAVFVDAYRELNHRKMFWIVLIISGLVVTIFAGVGIDDKGLYIFGFSLPIPFNTTIMPRADFYKMIFDSAGVGFWLSWLATILALISTAGIFPDMLTGGSIDLYLSKPISRLRLFLTKYLSALLFVALQVGVFTLASFLVLGFRAGAWLWGLFLAIPIMLLFFSYLYSICALFGIWTRSTLAALLLTLLAWCFIWVIHTTEASLLLFKLRNEQEAVMYDRQIVALEKKITRLESASTQPATKAAQTPVPTTPPATTEPTTEQADTSNDSFLVKWGRALIAQREISKPNEAIAEAKKQLEDVRKQKADFTNPLIFWHRLALGIKSVLPKTTETVSLLSRSLEKYADIRHQSTEENVDDTVIVPSTSNGDEKSNRRREHERDRVLTEQAQVRMVKDFNRRSLFWVIGTSLIFEGVMLSLAALIFCRRDF